MCAGIPYYANPNNLYISLPQALLLAFDFDVAFRATFLVFAAIGFWGAYLLLRRSMALSLPAALVGAAIFLWNGFYSHRFIVGHLAFHSFMLVPWIARVLTRTVPADPAARRWRVAVDSCLAGLGFAYMFQSANVHGLLPAVIAIACIGLLLSTAQGSGDGGLRFFWRRFAASGAVALALCAAKLAAALAFLDSFPRSGYPLPGAVDVGSAVRLVASALFAEAPERLASAVIVNVRWPITRQEVEYGVTVVPALLILGGVVGLLLPRAREVRRRLLVARWSLVGLVVLMALPIAINVHHPGWEASLKSVPVISSSVNLLRWLAAYIPIVAVAAAGALDLVVRTSSARWSVAAVAVVGMVALHAGVDRTFYAEQSYRPDRVAAAQRAALAGEVVPITAVGVMTDGAGRVVTPLERNDTMTAGVSQVLCYEPMFGYRQEWFPVGGLEPGPALLDRGGLLNMKNPACFLFPDANECRPGDPLRAEDLERARLFLDYGPFEHRVPVVQRMARWVNLAAIAAVALLFVAHVVTARRRRHGSSAKPSTIAA
jgi:hypothetical protein